MPPHARRLACTATAAAAARAVWAALHVLTVAAAADSAVAGGLRLLPRGAPVGASGVVSGAAAPLLPVAAVVLLLLLPAARAPGVGADALGGGGMAGVTLVPIFTEHGMGSSEYAELVGSHPCAVSLGEPFRPEERWRSLDGENAFYDASGGAGTLHALDVPEKLQFNLLKSAARLMQFAAEPRERKEAMRLAKLPAGLHRAEPSLLGYMREVGRVACASTAGARPAECGGRCLVPFKVFYVYVGPRVVETAAGEPARPGCPLREVDAGLSTELPEDVVALINAPDVAVLTLERDARAVAASVVRRFHNETGERRQQHLVELACRNLLWLQAAYAAIAASGKAGAGNGAVRFDDIVDVQSSRGEEALIGAIEHVEVTAGLPPAATGANFSKAVVRGAQLCAARVFRRPETENTADDKAETKRKKQKKLCKKKCWVPRGALTMPATKRAAAELRAICGKLWSEVGFGGLRSTW